MKNRFYILILISLFAISGCGISFNSKYEDNNSINITLEYNNGIGDFDIQNNIKKGSRFPSSGNLDEYFIYKKGYSFEGWYLNENFSGESFKYSYINKDLKLYAKWNELGDNINQVVFNSNGGNYISPIILNNGESISLVSPIKTNYLFTGWYNSKTLTGDPIWKIENVNHDTLLYAKWIEESDYLEDINNIEEKYTINFFANYAEGKMEPQIFYKGISQKIRINTFYQVDPNIIYEFIGWSTSLSGNVIFLDEELISIDNNMTLFAKFREYKPGFTLKYEPNGGTGQMRIQKFTDNETQLIQKNSFIPPDDSLKFIGWGYSPNGSISLQPGQSIYLESNMTLYALWGNKHTYSIKFDANGGIINENDEMIDQIFYKNEKQSIRKNIFMPNNELDSNISFLGWSKDKISLDYADQQLIEIESNMILYAMWGEIITEKIEFYPNGGYGNMDSLSF